MNYRHTRIVFCIDSFNAGGTEFNLVKSLEHMSAFPFERHLLTLNDRGSLRDRFVATGIPITEFAFPRLHSLRAASQAYRIIAWFRQIRPDVVHTNDRYTNLFVAPCARLAGVPLVVTSRRWWKAMPRQVYRLGNQVAYRLSHRIVANSPAVARMMSEEEGIPSSRIVVVPNFVDDAVFLPIRDEERVAARRRFGIPHDAILVTAVAIFRPEKNLALLIAAMALLHREHSRLHVLLVGSGPCEAELRQAVAQHGLADRIHFAGFLSTPPSPHQFGDIAVLCSLHEGFPNSIVEAMASGKPVVATRVGGIPDAVDEGRTGLLVESGAPGQLAGALGHLAADDGLRASMGHAGRLKARGLYTATAVLALLNDLYIESHSTAGPT